MLSRDGFLSYISAVEKDHMHKLCLNPDEKRSHLVLGYLVNEELLGIYVMLALC